MRTWINLADVPMPVRIARLARDARGYPIPYAVMYRSDGTPDFRAIDPEKWMRAARHRRCGICGDVLGAHLAFVGGPRSIENRLFTDLPMHRDCAIYALQVCPFLAAPSFEYSRKLPEGTAINNHVATDRPPLFGLGICRGFQLVRLPGNDIVIHAEPFENVEWWLNGTRTVAVPVGQRIGVAEGKFEMPDTIDSHNRDVERLFRQQ